MADDPRIEPMVALWRREVREYDDAPAVTVWTPEQFVAAMLAAADKRDPLRALLADEDRALTLLRRATADPGQFLPRANHYEWPTSWAARAVLAALREVAGL